MPVPELVAHRGWALHCPENTRAALTAAIGAGARFLETDVQVSSDGVPFLFHDRTLDRLCGVPGAVHERDARALAGLHASEEKSFGPRFASEPLARLGALPVLLAAHPSVFCFVELKRVSIEHHGVDGVLASVLPVLERMPRRCAIISFSLPVLLAARERTRLPLGAVLEEWSDLESADLRALAPDYVFADVRDLPHAGPLRLPSGRLAVYEVARPELALDLGERGAHFIETFAIGEMLSAFKHLGVEPGGRGGPGGPGGNGGARDSGGTEPGGDRRP